MVYRRYIKRILDVACSLLALISLCWLYAIVAMLVRIKLGSPVLYIQIRPGMIDRETGQEKLFKIYKFRTMTDEKDENGKHLPDEARLTKFGAWLRLTSLDEIPQAINILRGDMSVIGPRPQLVRDMVFMTDEQRKRHTVKPGLSGLAQVRGRNAISWEDKFQADLEYIKNVNFFCDVKIALQTVLKVILKEDINREDMATSLDYGDYLLGAGKISESEYSNLQEKAKGLLQNQL